MNRACRFRAAACLLAVGLLVTLNLAPAQGQVFSNPFELSESVHLDEVDSAARAHLERIKAYLADSQWDEAVETLRQVMENHGGKVIAVAPGRYINLADYCHVQAATLPDPALELYRQRVDPAAQKWYEEGIAQRDAGLLSNVVNQAFCSSWGDDALFALGELALEQGRPSIARGYWEKIVERPAERVSVAEFTAAVGREGVEAGNRDEVAAWYKQNGSADDSYRLRHDQPMSDETARHLVRFWKQAGLPNTQVAYPETTLKLADVRARLILASILEGSLERAKSELAAFDRLHPEAAGTIAGRKEPYAVALARLIKEADGWAAVHTSNDWSTFAGNPARNKIAREAIDIGVQLWPAIDLGEPLAADAANLQRFGLQRIAEQNDGLLSYHPLIVGNLLLFCNQQQIFAFDVRTGKPAWNRNDSSRKPGVIHGEEIAEAAQGPVAHGLGAPRFTMTAASGKLYARLGSQITTRPMESYEPRNGSLICLDLNAEGRLLWKITPDIDQWAFEGAPLVEGTDVYIAMRKNDVRPQSHIACFDAETGRRRWRVMICSAETPAGGQVDEITHNLLTLEQDILYSNTNLGAVAAVSAHDGHVQWISTYPRSKRVGPAEDDKRAAHFYRDLNPCVYHRGSLLVAPSDSEYILALDATTGQILWQTRLATDVVHLLGVGKGNLIASGDRLWWIDVEQGKVNARWPEQTPHGYGRGILAGDKVYWPTRDMLYIFDQKVAQAGHAPLVREPIPLVEGRHAGGGNLVISQGKLLISAANRLYVFDQHAGRAVDKVDRTTARPAAQSSGPLQRP